jgi:hypothetical protein
VHQVFNISEKEDTNRPYSELGGFKDDIIQKYLQMLDAQLSRRITGLQEVLARKI